MTPENNEMQAPPPPPPSRRERRERLRAKRSWKSRLGELALWAAVAIATALIMISMSEQLLPENF